MAIAANTVWDVKTTGNDSNGGGFLFGATGTDYSQQNSAQVAFTDLVIGATTTQLTSAANPFTAAYVGNIINITSGTGFTVGHYQVVSVSGAVATMDRAVGTAASTGGVGDLGGCKATIGAAAAAIGNSNFVFVQTGTYTLTTTILQTASAAVIYIGYGTTHGDNGPPPTVTTATNSIHLFTNNTGNLFFLIRNFILTSTASTKGAGILNNSSTTDCELIVQNCTFSNFSVGIGANAGVLGFAATFTTLINCSITGCTLDGIAAGNIINIIDCFITANHRNNLNLAGGWVLIERTVIAGAVTGKGILESSGATGTGNNFRIIDSTVANNLSDGISLTTGWVDVFVQNCLIYGNGGWGIVVSTGAPIYYANYNAVGTNTTGNYSGLGPGANDVALTANPFTNSASGDYSLNTTVGGGASCKGVGYPGVFPGGTSTGHLDIGAVESTGIGSGANSSTYLS